MRLIAIMINESYIIKEKFAVSLSLVLDWEEA